MNCENFLKSFANKYVFFPFIGMGFILGLLLLFYRDFESGSTLRNFLVPAITVYTIGILLLCYFYFELDVINCVRAAKNNDKAGPQPTYIIWIFRSLHGIWFTLLIIYLFWKIVL